jgi:N-acetylmuramoyl-L-alanine amidase
MVNNQTDSNANDEQIFYKVQISASKRRWELKSYNFNGLNDLSRIKEGKLYKYFYSRSKSVEDISKKMQHARLKGFSNAYIVGFKNGKLFEVE